jgi:hypothetical protein
MNAAQAMERVHEAYVEAHGADPTGEQVIAITAHLPHDITNLAEECGWSDTEVGDRLVRHIRQVS